MIRVRQIKIKVEDDSKELLLKKIEKKLNLKDNKILDYKISKQSIDARNKSEIYYVYEIDVTLENENIKLDSDILKVENEEYIYPQKGGKLLNNRPVIVGSGPSGLFSAYLLSKMGYNPIIIERGSSVDKRIEDVKTFWETGKLNVNSNIQFGEGGAGTFSDGKLNTLIKDTNNRMKYVFETFISCGAPHEILYSNKPHIGTDILVKVVKNMREEIKRLGGEFYFDTCLTDINIKDNKIDSIVINNKDIIKTDVLILAIGHSSRDTFRMLYDKKINMEPKGFAVGFRVIHNQDMINESQYGKYSRLLPPANYKVTYKSSNGRGVYSFCMCPGGYVVNASSEENRLVINGMSYSKRDSSTANSGIIVTVTPRDFGTNPLDGIKFQEDLEEKTYNLANGKIPIQLLGDFIDNKKSIELGNVLPNIKGSYELSNLNGLLPNELEDSFKESFDFFGKKIKGFNNTDTILAGIEARTSSPLRIIRNDNFESSIEGIYPCGEGCGYAGGITTAAIDGLKVAEKVIEKYK